MACVCVCHRLINTHTHSPTHILHPPTAQLDAKAHNIDLAAQKEAKLKKEWDAFQKFAGQVSLSAIFLLYVCVSVYWFGV